MSRSRSPTRVEHIAAQFAQAQDHSQSLLPKTIGAVATVAAGSALGQLCSFGSEQLAHTGHFGQDPTLYGSADENAQRVVSIDVNLDGHSGGSGSRSNHLNQLPTSVLTQAKQDQMGDSRTLHIPGQFLHNGGAPYLLGLQVPTTAEGNSAIQATLLPTGHGSQIEQVSGQRHGSCTASITAQHRAAQVKMEHEGNSNSNSNESTTDQQAILSSCLHLNRGTLQTSVNPVRDLGLSIGVDKSSSGEEPQPVSSSSRRNSQGGERPITEQDGNMLEDTAGRTPGMETAACDLMAGMIQSGSTHHGLPGCKVKKPRDEGNQSTENSNGSSQIDNHMQQQHRSHHSSKKPRLTWSPELHHRFMAAVQHLGVNNAVPKTILQLMNVEGMTRENVASHLQKYRLYLKGLAGLGANVHVPAGVLEQVQEQAIQQHAAKQAQAQVQAQHAAAAAAMQAQAQQISNAVAMNMPFGNFNFLPQGQQGQGQGQQGQGPAPADTTAGPGQLAAGNSAMQMMNPAAMQQMMAMQQMYHAMTTTGNPQLMQQPQQLPQLPPPQQQQQQQQQLQQQQQQQLQQLQQQQLQQQQQQQQLQQQYMLQLQAQQQAMLQGAASGLPPNMHGYGMPVNLGQPGNPQQQLAFMGSGGQFPMGMGMGVMGSNMGMNGMMVLQQGGVVQNMNQFPMMGPPQGPLGGFMG